MPTKVADTILPTTMNGSSKQCVRLYGLMG